MSFDECRGHQIELLNPVQVVPAPGELEIFPHVTLRQDTIVHMNQLHLDISTVSPTTTAMEPASSSAVAVAGPLKPQQRFHEARLRRSRMKHSRFRTQPITFAEIAEVDDEEQEEEKVAKIASSSSFQQFKFPNRPR